MSSMDKQQGPGSQCEKEAGSSAREESRGKVQLKASAAGLPYKDQQAKLSPPRPPMLGAQGQGAAGPGSGMSGSAPVQLKGKGKGGAGGNIQAAAARGTAGAGGSLPHGDKIQKAFGSHDVSGVKAHVGGQAAEASKSMGAEAYASGNSVAFKKSPDLHTAAHEAAHVVQQRQGVSLKGGVGKSGDRYEKQADKVADAVVAGKSAQGLLGSGGGGGGGGKATQKKASSGSGSSVQMRITTKKEPDDKETKDKETGTQDTDNINVVMDDDMYSNVSVVGLNNDSQTEDNSVLAGDALTNFAGMGMGMGGPAEGENEFSEARLESMKQSGAERSCKAAVEAVLNIGDRKAPQGSWLKEREFYWAQYLEITAIVAGISRRARKEIADSGELRAFLRPVPQAYYGHVQHLISKGQPKPMPPPGYESKWAKGAQLQAAAKKMLQYCGSLGKAFDKGLKEQGAVGNRDTIRDQELERYSTFFGFAGGALSAQDLEILEIYFQDACATSGDPNHSKWFDGALFGDKGDRVTAHMLNHTPYMPLQQEGGEGPPAREAQPDDEEEITVEGETMTKGEARDRLSLMRTRYLQLSDNGMSLVVYALREETSYQKKQGNNYAHHLIEQFAQNPPSPDRWESVRAKYQAAQDQLFAASTVDALPDAIDTFIGASKAFDAAKKPWGTYLDSYIDTGQEIYDATKMVRDKAFAAASKGMTLYLMAKGHSRAQARAEVTGSMAVLYGSANYLGQVLSDVEGGEVDWLEVFMETVEGLLVGFFNSDVKDPGGTLLGGDGPKLKDMITAALKSALKTSLGHVKNFCNNELKGRDPDEKKAAQARSKEVIKAAIDVGTSALQEGLMAGIGDDVVGGGLVKAFSGVIKDVLNETLQKVATGEEINSDDLLKVLLDSIGKISLDSVMGGGVDAASKK